ncbi:hypothetical protein [Pontimicrobium aquaticum]|uniref:Uncharacterized protein n=1 Tax=Pontimicrobium aquaticum TaxID=2565367 RepID=A0A4V5LPX0_9FLAO|nr:hypothetical protein [Pontimicrobium aquaticum]TJY32879.1 hypothetical protein E5167_13660 [Pontimicrobium aquaticum]
MAQDIRQLFENEQKVSKDTMPKGHEARFLQKLDRELPAPPKQSVFTFLNIAASVVILIGLSFGAYKFLDTNPDNPIGTEVVETEKESPLGKLSPELKKVEDYYLANINLELSKIEVTPETKELFEGYLERLEELNKEYELLSQELTKSGPTEQTINASIENLKLRLNLMYRLKEKLNELKNDTNQLEQIQA